MEALKNNKTLQSNIIYDPELMNHHLSECKSYLNVVDGSLFTMEQLKFSDL